MKIFDYEEVKMNWDSFTYPIAVGTPVSIDGVLADNASAHGLIARTVFAKPDADETLKVMTGGFIDMEEIVAGYGQELSSAAINALCGIRFFKNGACIPSGSSGGGGVTPEIMAQIENAQWKTESSEQIFSETVTTALDEHGDNSATLSYAEPITADTLKVTFNGVEYTCPKFLGDGYVAYGGIDETEQDFTDFTDFPFAIVSNSEGNFLYTETAGTFTVSAVAESTNYTSAFQEAVKSLSGAVEVQTMEQADVAIVFVNYSEETSVDQKCVRFDTTSATPTPEIFTGDAQFDGLWTLWRVDSLPTFSKGDMYLRNISPHGLTLIKQIYPASLGNYAYVAAPAQYIIGSNDVVKYYSLGLPHSIT